MTNRIKNTPLLLLCLFHFTACEMDEAIPFSDEELGVGHDITFEVLTQLPNLPNELYNYTNLPLPNHLQIPPVLNTDNTPANNPVTDEGATLGRVLFYDRNLSANNRVSCASCHVQAEGFSDSKTFSEGFEGGLTGRHSMSLVNATYYRNGAFFWDERAATLEEQTLMPIQDHIEMGMELDTLVLKLRLVPYYGQLFYNAFGTTAITSERISLALSQFVRSMVSYQTKYDEGRALLQPGQAPGDTPFPNFTDLENLGKALYFAGPGGPGGQGGAACVTCHSAETFSAPDVRNNGLDLVYEDQGVGDVTGNAQDIGDFKTPSLRSIALTAPYMHDGRFATLEEVIEHYNSGVQAHPNLSPPLLQPNGQVRRLNLTQNEKDALIAFLHTLTDEALATDEKYSNPFN
ncbi:MAG: cytochrome c peroxidase [Bacteroidota bacterium]